MFKARKIEKAMMQTEADAELAKMTADLMKKEREVNDIVDGIRASRKTKKK